MHNKTILSLSLAFFSRGANRPIWSDPVDNWTAIGLKLTVFGSCIPQLWLRGSVIGTFKLSHKIKYCEEINTLIDLQINLIIPLPSPDQTILRWPPLLTQYNSLQVARDTILCAPSEHSPCWSLPISISSLRTLSVKRLFWRWAYQSLTENVRLYRLVA